MIIYNVVWSKDPQVNGNEPWLADKYFDSYEKAIEYIFDNEANVKYYMRESLREITQDDVLSSISAGVVETVRREADYSDTIYGMLGCPKSVYYYHIRQINVQ